MSHQPFESWLLMDKSELDFEKKRSLKTHLETCSSCQDLQDAWTSVERSLRFAPKVLPAEGFAQRWEISLEARQEMSQRRQVARLLLVLSGAAVISLVLVAVQFVMSVSLIDWGLSMVQGGLRILAQSQILYTVLFGWAQRIPIQVVVGGWLLVFGLFSSLTALWMLSLQRIKTQGVY